MVFHSLLGVSAKERGWVPAPRYILRRDRILNFLDDLPRGHLLEVGCGAGALIVDCCRLGFRSTAVEISPNARKLAEILNRDNEGVRILDEPEPEWTQCFDVVLAFEVLEHIEDDLGALKQWVSWVVPGGRIMLSVPAHPNRWNAADVWAGHVRRYERAGLEQVLSEAGLEIERFECYGFPLANLIEPLRAYVYGRDMRKKPDPGDTADSAWRRTKHSGFDRPLDAGAYFLWSNPITLPFLRLAVWIQRRFLHTDWGNGYLVLARRK